MKNIILTLFALYVLIAANTEYDQVGYFKISRIQYGGGGDWYADPSSLYNLLNYVESKLKINVVKKEDVVKVGDENFYKNNYFYLTGHGNIKFNEDEIVILREHLLNGAFLHADDNYGMDKSFRKIIKEIFPENNLVEIPANHKLFNIVYDLPNGLPKIHEHNNQRPQALGIFHDDKLIVLYTYESDLGDGWEDESVHNVPNYKRESALKMGANIITYFLTN